MPSKSSKRARRATAKVSNAPQPKDNGTRWLVMRDGAPVYRSVGGMPRGEAERLAGGLLRPAEIIEIAPASA